MGSVAQIFWTNDVIWRKIVGYLTISDLKELCCVSKDFLEKVRLLSRFTSAAGQSVSGDMEIHTFLLSRAIVKVNTLNPEILREVASTTFQETEYLELHGFDDLSDVDLNSRLIQIVSGCPKLKSLTFEKLNFYNNDFRPFLRNDGVKLILANLKEMQIGKPERNYVPNTFFLECVTTDEARLGTYELFSDLPTKLVKFVYSDPPIFMSTEHLLRLLNNNNQTLQELKLTTDFKGLEQLKQLRFPKLTKLDLAVLDFGNIVMRQPGYEISMANFLNDVIPFVKNHLPNLSEFAFSSNHGFCLTRFCDLLRQPKYSEKIKVLGFQTSKGFTESFLTINWEFLKAMPNLRAIDLGIIHGKRKQLYCLEDIRQSLYYSLPSNIQSIEFGVFKYDCPLQEMLNKKSSVLLGFTNLTALNIQCQSFLNDKMLQFICENLIKLTSFKGNFAGVTAFGISGVNTNRNVNTGISIANLRSLTELEIDCGEGISLDNVLNAARFLFLEKLAVDWPERTNEWSCPPEKLWPLLRQNPCLECIRIWVNPPVMDIREEVRQFHPRFQWGWPTESPNRIYANTGRFRVM